MITMIRIRKIIKRNGKTMKIWGFMVMDSGERRAIYGCADLAC